MTLLPSPFPLQSEFEFWLATIDPTYRFEDWSCLTCPIATFLKSCGFDNPAVFLPERGWCVGGWDAPLEQRRELPAWAKEFVYWADKVKPRKLTPADCRYLLTGPHFKPERWNKEG